MQIFLQYQRPDTIPKPVEINDLYNIPEHYPSSLQKTELEFISAVFYLNLQWVITWIKKIRNLSIVARILHTGRNKVECVLEKKTFDDREEIHSLAADCSMGVSISIDGVLTKLLIKLWRSRIPTYNIAAPRHERTQQVNEGVKFLAGLK